MVSHSRAQHVLLSHTQKPGLHVPLQLLFKAVINFDNFNYPSSTSPVGPSSFDKTMKYCSMNYDLDTRGGLNSRLHDASSHEDPTVSPSLLAWLAGCSTITTKTKLWSHFDSHTYQGIRARRENPQIFSLYLFGVRPTSAP
jgi:hypothetical protein